MPKGVKYTQRFGEYMRMVEETGKKEHEENSH